MQQSQRTTSHPSQWVYANGPAVQMAPRNLAFDSRTQTMTTFGSPLPPLPIVYSPSLATSMSASGARVIDEDYSLGGATSYYDNPELAGSQTFAGELLYSSNSFGNWEKANVVPPSETFKQGYISPSNSRYLESSTRFEDTPPVYGQHQRYASEGYTDSASQYSHSRTASFEEEFSAGIRLGHQVHLGRQRVLLNGDGSASQPEYYAQEQQQPVAYVQPAEVAEHQYGSPSMAVQALLPEANSEPFPTSGDAPSPVGYASSPGLTSDKDDSMSDASGDDEDGEYDPADSDYDGSGPASKTKTRPGRARAISGASAMSLLSDESHARAHRRRATRAPAPVPIANLTKKSRGRRVPTGPTLAEDEDGKNLRPHVCPAENCFKRFGRTEHLKRHVRSIHTDEKPHQCPAPGCRKTFSRHDNLNQHMRVHKNYRRY